MHRVTAVAATILLAGGIVGPLQGQGFNFKRGPDQRGTLPAGWSARPDSNGKVEQVKFTTMGPGYHVTLGPATVLYRASDQGTGPFHTSATFTQTKAPQHAEGYGLFYGGAGLTGADQRYTYFLIRGDGKYLVKRRDGSQTTEVKPWTAHPAIKAANSSGKATNLIEINAKRDPARVEYKVNGQVVYSMDAAAAQIDGVVGIRASHDLDLHIEGFGVHR